jgi:Peptidase family M1 domain/Peptidase M1 N-terminal domain/Immune inhibitor A-like, MAM domain
MARRWSFGGGRRAGGTALVALALGAIVALGPSTALGHGGGGGSFEPGAPGAGDPYYPLDGNGGYDVSHYLLQVKYDPDTDVLRGTATIRAKATQNLSQFDLDLLGLTVHSVKVDGRRASWTRDGQELVITPKNGIRKRRNFKVVVHYSGIPESVEGAGFIATDDGALVIGEPHVASTWFPVNDHPSDKASYSFEITVPAGLEAVANGVLRDKRTKHGWTTWSWEEKDPMASYLATATMGEFDIHAYRKNGIRFWDAVDPDLHKQVQPHSGSQYAISQKGDPSYKRLERTISVPGSGATLTFWVNRNTEGNWDFFFVEAHTAGMDDWTTLPDGNGHTSQDTGFVCPFSIDLHPFLAHYETANDEGGCDPSGTTGDWHAISGSSGGAWEQWSIDLSAFAGKTAEVSLSYASDDLFQLPGVFVDDIVVSTGAGTTSFEDDGDTMDGWTVPGAPPGSAPNPNDWIVGTPADAPPPIGAQIDDVFALQPEILEFEANHFGRYPFRAGGGLVDDVAGLGFALENQTRPIYAIDFFVDQEQSEDVVVHELAHQWYGDSLAVAQWQHIWLNEGFATYAEWLWNEEMRGVPAQDIFDFYYSVIPDDDPFWQVIVGDPGPDFLFDFAEYARGAMTLHQLRLAVGDDDFFKILKQWAKKNAGGNVTTDEFIALAEKISGQQLDDLFETWLFTPGKPTLPTAMAAQSLSAVSILQGAAVAGSDPRLKTLRH